jgi:hypothetical protein
MRLRTFCCVLMALIAGAIGCGRVEREAEHSVASDCSTVNILTGPERAAGWELIFNGKDLEGWHAYNGQSTSSWTVEDCALKSIGTEGNYGSDLRADLVTDKQYENFEISIDWKASKGGNSGLMYGVVEDAKFKAAWMTGPEYQFIDEVGFPEKLEEWQKAGVDYGMHLPSGQKNLKPVGEWNDTKILVNGTHVEHWLNGGKLLEFERWNDEWKKLRESEKWKDYPDYGLARTGHIVLQDHGSLFWFRNIKIREIK